MPAGLETLRLAEAMVTGPQPVWKLFGAGSAGSQALTGIPYARKLREDIELVRHTSVWPFETGLAAPFGQAATDRRIVFAEVYPSLIDSECAEGECKDRAQTRTLAQHFARLDEKGRLARLLAGPPALTLAEREAVEQEEGWILGVV